MWYVVVSAFLLSILNAVKLEYEVAALLGFLSLLTANPLYYGIAILREKKGVSPRLARIHLLLNVSITLSALALITFGITLEGSTAGILMLIFGLIGLTSGMEVYSHFRKLRDKKSWIVEHLSSMFITGIAAYTAFFAFGGRHIFRLWLVDYLQVLPWLLPTIIGAISIRMMVRKYQPSSKNRKARG